MKTLRRISALTLLSLTLSISVLAGQVEFPGIIKPPDPPPTSQMTQTTDSTTEITIDVTTEIVLAVLDLIYR